jgi:hypothetical protein
MTHATVVAWDRAEAGLVSRANIVERYSAQHVVRDNGEHAMCGARVPWPHLTAGDARRCARCFAAAKRCGLRDEYGEAIGEGA